MANKVAFNNYRTNVHMSTLVNSVEVSTFRVETEYQFYSTTQVIENTKERED